MAKPVVECEHISMQFGAIQALNDVGITVEPGTIHGLLGQNGSGKSTLIKILAGFYTPAPGARIHVNGHQARIPIDFSKKEIPIGFVHQSLGLFLDLSVTENLMVRDWSRGLHWLRWRTERNTAEGYLKDYGLVADGKTRASKLAPHERAIVAIVRAVHDMGEWGQEGAHEPRLLVLDEPSTYLSREERQKLHQVLRQIAGSGDAVLLVSHDIDEVLEVTTDVTVLRDGMCVGTSSTAELTEQDLVKMILGRSHERVDGVASASHRNGGAQAPLAVAENITGRRLKGLSFEVHRGELLGVTGLEGSGVEDLPYALFGAMSQVSGTVTVDGERLDLTRLSPQAAMHAGLAFVPRDREEEGGVGSLPAGDNLLLGVLNQYARLNILKTRPMRRAAHKEMQALQVVPPDPSLRFGMLSGGNQQKVLFGKWLVTRPRLLIACEPTQGVDVGARLELLRRLRGSITSGFAGIVSSVDYEQLVGLCDRILILREGVIVASYGPEVTKEELGAAILARKPTAQPQAVTAGPESPRGEEER